MALIRWRLQKILGLPLSDETQRTIVNHSDHGPDGEYDFWRHAEDKEHNWQQTKILQDKNTKPKIIFSHPLLRKLRINRKINDVERNFFEDLCERYQIYLWPGDQIPLRDCQPIVDADEFMSRMEEAFPATADQVIDTLGLQNVTSKEFLFWDYEADTRMHRNCFEAYLNREIIKKDQRSKYNFNLSEESVDISNLTASEFEILRQSVDFSKIKKVRMKYNLEMTPDFIVEQFPQLKKLTIENASDAWIRTYLPVFPEKLAVELTKLVQIELQLPDNTKLQSLTISHSPVLELILAGTAILNMLEVDFCEKFWLVYNNNGTDQVNTLKISNIENTDHIVNINYMPNVNDLILHNINYSSDLKSRRESKSQPAPVIDISHFTQLQRLEIDVTMQKRFGPRIPSDLKELCYAIPPDRNSKRPPTLPEKHRWSTKTVLTGTPKIQPIREELHETIETDVDFRKEHIPSTQETRNIKRRVITNNINDLSLMNTSLPNLKEIVVINPTFDDDLTTITLPATLHESLTFNQDRDYSSNGMHTLDVSNMTQLKEFCCHLNSIVKFILPPPKHLTKLDIISQEQKILDLSDYTELQTLIVIGGTRVILPRQPNKLRNLTLAGSQIEELNLKNVPHLKTLKLSSCQRLTSIAFGRNLPIENLSLEKCPRLTPRGFTSFKNLREVKITGCPQHNRLDFAGLTKLTHAYIGSREKVQYGEIDFKQCQSLEYVVIENAKESTLDLGGCRALRSLRLDWDGNMEQLRLGLSKEYPNLRSVIMTGGNIQPFADTVMAHLREEDKARCLFDITDTVMPANTLQSLDQRNKQSNIACFQYQTEDQIDANTGGVIKHAARADDLKVALYCKKNISAHEYRIDLYDIIETTVTHPPGKLTTQLVSKIKFTSKKPNLKNEIKLELQKDTLTRELIQEKKQSAQSDSNKLAGYFEGTLGQGVFALPGIEPIPKHTKIDIITDPPNAIRLFHDAGKQQYYFSPTTHAVGQKIKILYSMPTYPASTKELKSERMAKSDSPLLDPIVIQRMITLFQHKIAKSDAADSKAPCAPGFKTFLKVLQDTTINPDAKIRHIMQYCADFSNDPLTPEEAKRDFPLEKDLEDLCITMVYQKGECRHRARAAMLLSHWIKTPSQMPKNERHQFCEIPAIDATGQMNFRAVELGGGDMQDDTPEGVRVFSDVKTKKATPEQKTLSTHVIADQFKQTIYDNYYREFKNLAETTELNTLNDIVNPIINKQHFILPPLIELQPNQKAEDLKQALYNQLNEKKFDVTNKFIYINSAEQFKRFLQPLCLQEGQWKRKEGPLSRMQQGDGGVVVVNWSNFSATQIASFKSILDSAPMLFDLSLPMTDSKDDPRPLIKVIGITKSETRECSAFKSRCKSLKLAKEFPFVSEQKSEAKTASVPKFVIDLHHRASWRKEVFGKLTLDHGKMNLQPSEFMKHVALGKPFEVVFQNPPVDNPEFDFFLEQVRDEKRLFFEDRFIPLHAGTAIKTDEKKYNTTLPSNIYVNEVKDLGRRKIYIDINQLTTLVEQVIYNKDDPGTTKEGLLKESDPEKDIFFLVDSIPQSEWQAIPSEIRKKYPDKDFHFQTAEGVEIGNLPQSKNTLVDEKALPDPDLILTSNDPDLVTKLAAEEEKKSTLIIDVTAETELKDLLIDVRSRAKESHFDYRESAMLKALREVPPRTVILNGELSPALYKRLMPLFTADPHIQCNGERIKITGKLMWVLPEKTRKNIPLLRHDEAMVSWDSYREYYGSKPAKALAMIEQFYSFVNQLPHRGDNMPPFPELSHHHLDNMIDAIEQKTTLHRHNPIKHLFLFDYQKKSEDYAYLNVMAKCTFRPNDTDPRRYEKLAEIIREYGITTPDRLRKCLFRVLNCFNGAELQKMLGEKKENMLLGSGMPTLTDDALKNVFNIIMQPAPSLTPHKKKDRFKKQLAEFDYLLNDPNSPYILLKGPTGVGKSLAVRGHLKEEYCEEKNIVAWLTGKKKYLLLDEANMAQPGKWNFLKGLSRPDRTVYYNGIEYSLNENQKVIFTGNPENYPGRFYHRFIQHYAKTVYFKKPTDEYLIENTLTPLLSPKLNQYSQDLLFAYHLIEKFNPFLTSSFRDINSLTSRFVFLAKNKTDKPGLQRALLDACIGEYAGAIRDVTKRNQFIGYLSAKFNVALREEKLSPVIQVTPDLMTTREKDYLLKTVEQDLHQRNAAVAETKGGTTANYKTALLVEGNPGAGKSTLLKEILIKNKMEFIQIAAGSADTHAKLKEAFRDRKVVLLEEFNLDEELETLLNQLLSGMCDGKPAEGPGFMVIASQNTTTTAGRKTLSPALLDRTHLIYMDAYLKQELIELSKAHNITEHELFVDAFLKICDEFPDRANMRTFYTLLKTHAKKAPVLTEEKKKTDERTPPTEQKSIAFITPKIAPG